MGRTARFNDQHFITAAQAILAAEGLPGLTMQKIAGEAGATTGSVYHRFDSIDGIAALAWIEAAEAFQRGFQLALLRPAAAGLYDAVLAGALYSPEWSRQNLTQALVLLRFDATEAGGILRADPQLSGRIARLGSGQRRYSLALLKRFGFAARAQRGERLQLLQFLTADMPLAAAKPHLKNNRKPPAYVDEFIRTTVEGFRGELR